MIDREIRYFSIIHILDPNFMNGVQSEHSCRNLLGVWCMGIGIATLQLLTHKPGIFVRNFGARL